MPAPLPSVALGKLGLACDAHPDLVDRAPPDLVDVVGGRDEAAAVAALEDGLVELVLLGNRGQRGKVVVKEEVGSVAVFLADGLVDIK